jgi:hypothetical protein
VTCLCDGRAEWRDPVRARHRVPRGMRPPGPVGPPQSRPVTSNTRTTSSTTPAMRSATWSARAPRQARHGSTRAWGMYRRRPALSVRFLLNMLESCENRAGGAGRRTPRIQLSRPLSATSWSAQDQRPPLTLDIGPAVTGGGRLANGGAPPITYAWRGLGRLWGSRRGASEKARCSDLGRHTRSGDRCR